ncbi:hypothetical protein J3E69DRAFT_224440 [Trichoderma sp. SZMC 28015]
MQCSQASSYFPPPRSPAEITKKETKAAERETWRQRIERSARGSNTGGVSASTYQKRDTRAPEAEMNATTIYPIATKRKRAQKRIVEERKKVCEGENARETRKKERGQTGIVGRRTKTKPARVGEKFRQKRMKMEEGNEEREKRERGQEGKDVKAAVRCQGRSEKKSLSVSRCSVLAILGQRRDEEEANAMRRARVDFGAGVACCRSQVQGQGQMRVLVQVPVQRTWTESTGRWGDLA